ncbi:MAG: phage portal protein, partial [Gemmatimonadetes bacterium]|nr:phage portal protein [Gemmatimonadota bacterium]
MGFLTSLERRASPENPTTSLANPASWLMEAFGSTPTWTGNRVNNSKANLVAAWFQGVNIIAKGVASTPLHTYRRLDPRGRDKASDQRVYHLLKTRPNPESTAYDYHEMM